MPLRGQIKSWKLIGLAQYVQQPTWKNDRGEEWSVERLVKERMAKPANSTTARRHDPAAGPGLDFCSGEAPRRQWIDGEYLQNQTLYRRIKTGLLLAQSERRRQLGACITTQDYPTALMYTGHVFEWLAFDACRRIVLQDRQIVQSVQYCTGLLGSQHYQSDVQSLSGREIAAVMHAAHALVTLRSACFRPGRLRHPPAAQKAGRRPAALAFRRRAVTASDPVARRRFSREILQGRRLASRSPPSDNYGTPAWRRHLIGEGWAATERRRRFRNRVG